MYYESKRIDYWIVAINFRIRDHHDSTTLTDIDMIWVIWRLLVKSLLQAEIRKIHRSNEVQKREQVESRTKFEGIENLQYDLTKQKLGLIALQRPYRNSGNAWPIKFHSTNRLVRRWPLSDVACPPGRTNLRRFLLWSIAKYNLPIFFERFFKRK